ncbi:hypothetical protein [Leptolyngbya sp. 7M]|uniref:hypothetical protein n=1 Tax=Leptolyngbya sp. 7M TaxID=2812896 RepID=UPI001B8C0DD0|nr:hypothetical protein [Leptolyngbya sp. 7M]QYO63128.1 hypothetical protein JVX88_24665 [Leptolyngbya sp. 7M]
MSTYIQTLLNLPENSDYRAFGQVKGNIATQHNNPNAPRPPRGYLLGIRGCRRRVIGNDYEAVGGVKRV